MNRRRLPIVLRLAVLAVLLTTGCNGGIRSLLEAIKKEDRGRVEALVAADPGLVNASFPRRRGVDVAGRPLHQAAAVGNVEIATFLLDKGADISATHSGGETALHMAARYGKIPIVVLLVKRGAKVDARDRAGETPLYYAMFGEPAQALIAAGADVNVRNRKGVTPLHQAATYATIGNAIELCAAGADMTARDGEGVTPEGRAGSTASAMKPWMHDVCPRLAALHARNKVVAEDARAAALYEYHCSELSAETPDPRKMTTRSYQARSCTVFGSALASGVGIERNVSRAAAAYQAACDGGDVPGCGRQAAALEGGEGVARDEGRAAVLYEKACKEKEGWACTRLALLHEQGRGVAKDDKEAAAWHEKGCTLGSAEGCNGLGVLLTAGRGGPVDKVRARSLFKQACEGGLRPGCQNAQGND